MLAPAAVRRDLLRAAGQAGTLLGGGRRVAAAMVDQALERLNERSLLSFSLDGQAVSVHCLVARVVREGLARRGRLVDGMRGGRRSPGNVRRGLAEAAGSRGGQGNARSGHGAAGKRGGAADDARRGLATMLIAASVPWRCIT